MVTGALPGRRPGP